MTLDTKTDPDRRRHQFLKLARDAGYKAQKLADLCSMSLRQLERQFMNDFGCSPALWLRKERIRSACRMLEDADSVKEVAYALGFHSPSHFSTLFKRETGVTPTDYAYRAVHRGYPEEQMPLFSL